MYSSNIPRCQHIKVNGTQCGSPAVRDRRFCFFHKKWRDQRIVINSAQARQSPPTLDLPVLEDANSIQVALMQVMRLLISHQIDHKTAGLLLYALQTASFNLRRTDFEPVVKTKIVIDPTRVDESALGDPENPEETEEEDAEEAENGHLEIQAMAAPNPRSDRRLACPAPSADQISNSRSGVCIRHALRGAPRAQPTEFDITPRWTALGVAGPLRLIHLGGSAGKSHVPRGLSRSGQVSSKCTRQTRRTFTRPDVR